MNRRRSRRIVRVRNELRLWLRSRYGHRLSYSKAEIDGGREDLGFKSADDAFIAYSIFGADLSPGAIESLELSMLASDLSELTAAGAGDSFVTMDFLGDD